MQIYIKQLLLTIACGLVSSCSSNPSKELRWHEYRHDISHLTPLTTHEISEFFSKHCTKFHNDNHCEYYHSDGRLFHIRDDLDPYVSGFWSANNFKLCRTIHDLEQSCSYVYKNVDGIDSFVTSPEKEGKGIIVGVVRYEQLNNGKYKLLGPGFKYGYTLGNSKEIRTDSIVPTLYGVKPILQNIIQRRKRVQRDESSKIVNSAYSSYKALLDARAYKPTNGNDSTVSIATAIINSLNAWNLLPEQQNNSDQQTLPSDQAASARNTVSSSTSNNEHRDRIPFLVDKGEIGVSLGRPITSVGNDRAFYTDKRTLVGEMSVRGPFPSSDVPSLRYNADYNYSLKNYSNCTLSFSLTWKIGNQPLNFWSNISVPPNQRLNLVKATPVPEKESREQYKLRYSVTTAGTCYEN